MALENVFKEQQYFRQSWLWILLTGINGLFIFGLVKQVLFGEVFGNNPMNNETLIIITMITLVITISFIFIRLETVIDQVGIHYQYFPFQTTVKTITWDRISKSYVRQYNPIAEYGGWGLRLGLFGSGQAFNVSGNQGLQIVYDNGKKFLIGTQKPNEIIAVLEKLGQLKN